MEINVQYLNKFDKLLPFANILDDEANKFFHKIKHDFAELHNNSNPHEYLLSCLIQLHRFLNLYSLKFSKEDHITLFNFIYNLLLIKDLQFDCITLITKILIELLKKKNKLTREDLVIQWKPLCDFYCDQYSSKTIRGHKTHNQAILIRDLEDFLLLAKVYFPVEATKEIYDFLKPKLYPFHTVSIFKSHRILFHFLPHITVSDLTEYSYKYWLNNLMTNWMTFRKLVYFETDIMLLISNLAACNIGYIDWEPYLPFVYSKILLSLNLPVYYENKNYSNTYIGSTTNICMFIINTLDENNSSIKYFSNLMQTIESYYYPANIGPWFIKLRTFLKQLSDNLINRLRVEKFPKKRHFYIKVNEERRLTDNLIEQFMLTVKPIINSSLLTFEPPDDNTSVLSNFATIRPDIVVPLVLDKFYSLCDTSTEPKKLTAIIICVYDIVRFLVNDQEDTDRRQHVVPILMTSLQWIDFNDINRFGNVLLLIKGIVQMIPLVDCSLAVEFYPDLSENDRLICEATSMFEDFVLQFFDRILTAIDQIHNENFRPDQVNYDFKILDDKYCKIIWSVVPIILSNSHPTIFEKSLIKFIRYIDDRIYGDQLSATMLGMICKCFMWVSPQNSLEKLMNFFFVKINPHLNEIKPTDENLSLEFLYFFTILSNGILVSGVHLIPYMNELILILNKTLYLEHEVGQKLACSLLTTLMYCFGSYYYLNTNNFQIPLDTPIKDHLFIRDWGKTYYFHEIKCEWHIPNEDEILNIQRLIKEFLFPQYKSLHDYAINENISGTIVKIPLKIVSAIFKCDIFPNWDDEPLLIINDEKQLKPFIIDRKLILDVGTLDGKNLKKLFADVLHRVGKKLLSYNECNSGNLKQLSMIFGLILDSDSMLPSYYLKSDICRNIENRLNEYKKNIRLTYLVKIYTRSTSHFKPQERNLTETSRQIMLDLLVLATHFYYDVRDLAKKTLIRFIKSHPVSLQLLIPKLVEILQLNNPSENKESIIGCLNLLFSEVYPRSTFISMPKIPIVREIWKACLKMENTEEISIISMLNRIVTSVIGTFVPIKFFNEIPMVCFTGLLKFCYKDNFPNSIEFENFSLSLRNVSDKSNQELDDILAQFLEILQNNRLHWRSRQIGLNFLKELVACDVKINKNLLEFVLKCLIDDLIMIRQTALFTIISLLKKMKPIFQKTELHPYNQTENLLKETNNVTQFGIRPDNKWLEYCPSLLPDTEMKWNNMIFIHKPYLGFSTWDETIEVFAPYSQQIDRQNDLSLENQVLFDYFSNKEFIDKLIQMFSMEEKKDNEIFDGYRFNLFKNIFRKFENLDLDLYKNHINLLTDSDLESHQKCAAELTCGMIRGSKHWSFSSIEKMKQIISPILIKITQKVTIDTCQFWCIGIFRAVQSRDPRSLYWIFETLINFDINSSSIGATCYHLKILNCLLKQNPWKIDEYKKRIFDKIITHFNHPFEMIRNEISNLLCNLYAMDTFSLNYNSNDRKFYSICDLFDSLVPKLSIGLSKDKCNEQKDNENLLNILSTWMSIVLKSNYVIHPEFYRLLPYVTISTNESNKDNVNSFIGLLAYSLTLPSYLINMFDACDKILTEYSWHSKVILCKFLKVFVFSNLFIILKDQNHVHKLKNIVFTLLEDERLEVCEEAIKLLSGLIHYHVISDQQDLLEEFKSKSNMKIKKSDELIKIRRRNSGVYGLCAFIDAYPYSIPDFFNDIFLELGKHLNTSHSIPKIINKTISNFKRTHQDDWNIHKLQFTEEQLVVLNELTTPPSYYA